MRKKVVYALTGLLAAVAVLSGCGGAAKAIQTPPQMPAPEGPCICLHIEKKALGIAGVWNPDSGFRRNLPGDWASPSRVNLSHGAPVLCFFDYSGKNCFTLA